MSCLKRLPKAELPCRGPGPCRIPGSKVLRHGHRQCAAHRTWPIMPRVGLLGLILTPVECAPLPAMFLILKRGIIGTSALEPPGDPRV
ncbi:hypothetical protein BX600DRAFT_489463 [Xylariales sp. PMI_506]|nr:hypothetical protein BX600DRAFT_489463 [Xylariales sp. PMI_506]